MKCCTGHPIHSNKIWFHKPDEFMETRQSRPKWEHLSFDKKISGKPKNENSNKLFGLVMGRGREDLQGFGLHSELFSIFLNDLGKGTV